MGDLTDKLELYDYIQKEKAWEQSRTRLPLFQYERELPDACYEMLDKLDKINEFNAKQLACTAPKVYILTDLHPTVDIERIERHAHWNDDFSFKSNAKRVDICSCCKSAIYRDIDSDKYNYCPNCGCKMDEVTNNDG